MNITIEINYRALGKLLLSLVLLFVSYLLATQCTLVGFISFWFGATSVLLGGFSFVVFITVLWDEFLFPEGEALVL